MATRKSTKPKSSLESVNEIYAARVGNLEAAEEAKATEAAEEAKATEEVHTGLPEELQFGGAEDETEDEVVDEDEAK